MKRVIRSNVQLANIYDEMLEGLQDLLKADKSMIIEFKPFKPPRTLSQSRKIHAMMNEIGAFTGDENIKMWIKNMDFWPTEYKEHFGDPKIVPKSEASLSRGEESIIIERLYQLATMLPGFEFTQ